MTFRLFTDIAKGGSLEHIHICVPFQPVGEVTTGPSVIRFFPSVGTSFPTLGSVLSGVTTGATEDRRSQAFLLTTP